MSSVQLRVDLLIHNNLVNLVQVEAGLQGDEDTVAGSTWIHVNLKPKGGLNP